MILVFHPPFSLLITAWVRYKRDLEALFLGNKMGCGASAHPETTPEPTSPSPAPAEEHQGRQQSMRRRPSATPDATEGDAAEEPEVVQSHWSNPQPLPEEQIDPAGSSDQLLAPEITIPDPVDKPKRVGGRRRSSVPAAQLSVECAAAVKAFETKEAAEGSGEAKPEATQEAVVS